MRLSRKQLIYGGVLALGVGALLVDRLVLRSESTGPSDASAYVVKTEHSGPSGGAAPKVAGAAGGERVDAEASAQAAQRLTEYGEKHGVSGGQVVDAFRPGWVAEPDKPGGTAPAGVSQDQQKFIKEHRLAAVVAGARGSFAIIDGRDVLPGQTIDGYKLVSLSNRTATLEGPAGTVTLTMESDAKPR